MIRGMTGYGNAQIVTAEMTVTIEIKSLNHRYFDITFYLPIGFASIENKIRQIVQKEIERGRITVSLKITQKCTQPISLNKENVKKYLKYAYQINKEFSLKNDLTISDLVKLPGVFETKEISIDPEATWTVIEKGI